MRCQIGCSCGREIFWYDIDDQDELNLEINVNDVFKASDLNQNSNLVIDYSNDLADDVSNTNNPNTNQVDQKIRFRILQMYIENL